MIPRVGICKREVISVFVDRKLCLWDITISSLAPVLRLAHQPVGPFQHKCNTQAFNL